MQQRRRSRKGLLLDALRAEVSCRTDDLGKVSAVCMWKAIEVTVSLVIGQVKTARKGMCVPRGNSTWNDITGLGAGTSVLRGRCATARR